MFSTDADATSSVATCSASTRKPGCLLSRMPRTVLASSGASRLSTPAPEAALPGRVFVGGEPRFPETFRRDIVTTPAGQKSETRSIGIRLIDATLNLAALARVGRLTLPCERSVYWLRSFRADGAPAS